MSNTGLNANFLESHAVSARILALESNLDEGLLLIAGRTDSESVLRRLQILIDAQRFEEATESILDIPPDPRWCDKAIFVRAASGNFESARDLLAWSERLDNYRIRQRCSLQYANGVLVHLSKKRGSTLRGYNVSEEEKRTLKLALDALERITSLVESNRKIANPLELKGIEAAAQLAWALGDSAQCLRFASWLASHPELSDVYVRLVVAKAVPPFPELPDQIRSIFVDDLTMQFYAVRIQSLLLNDDVGAFDNGLKLARKFGKSPEASNGESRYDSPSSMEDLFWLMRDIALRLGGDHLKQVSEVSGLLLQANSRTLRLNRALEYLEAQRPEEAFHELAESEDLKDPVWLQADAHRLHQLGDDNGAAERLFQASRIVENDFELWKWAATAAFNAGVFKRAEEALKAALELQPDDEESRRNLGVVLALQEDYLGAAECYDQLRERDDRYALEAVKNYAYGGDLDRAIRVAGQMTTTESPSEISVFWYSDLLLRAGRAHESFEFLNSKKAYLWDKPGLLQHFMNVAYAAGEDHEADLAVGQLLQFREKNLLPDGAFELKHVEELIGEIGEHAKTTRESLSNVTKGRIPWFMLARFEHKATMWAWHERTQELEWLAEMPHARGRHSVYSTNRYSACDSSHAERDIWTEIKSSDSGGRVMVDATALITLYRLGYLEKLTTYFERCAVPACYTRLSYEEAVRMQPHQLSWKENYELLKHEIERGRIRTRPKVPDGAESVLVVRGLHDSEEVLSEYADLGDVLDYLHQLGKIGSDVLEHVLQARPRVITHEHTAKRFDKGTHVHLELSALEDLVRVNCLDEFLTHFIAYTSTSTRETILVTLNGFSTQAECQRAHRDLWDSICKSDIYEKVTSAPTSDDENEPDFDLAALMLSRNQKIPLLVDDRILQVARQREEDGVPGISFGTDAFLDALWRGELISATEFGDSYLALMKWRFRFLMPPLDLLIDYAKRRQANMPGSLLEATALYLHDCVRDPGLFSGNERAEPPRSMATRFVSEWATLTARLLGEVWKDRSIEVVQLEKLTNWAARRFLPSIPHGLGPEAFEIAKNLNRALVSLSILHGLDFEDPTRIRIGLRFLADSLGFSEAEVLDIGVEMLSRDSDADTDFTKLLLTNLLGDEESIARKHLLLVKSRGLLSSDRLPPLDLDTVELLLNAGLAQPFGPNDGPLLFFVREDGRNEVLSLPDALFVEDAEHRLLVASYVKRLAETSSEIIGLDTLENLKHAEKDLCNDKREIWTKATLRLSESLRQDFLLNLSGVRQSLRKSFNEGINHYVQATLMPDLDSMNGLPISFPSPSSQEVDIRTRIRDIAQQETTLEDAMDDYFACLGHLPMTEGLSMASLVTIWSESHSTFCVSAESLWAWAQQKNCPFADYHVCQVLCCRPELLALGSDDKFWSTVNTIITAGAELDEPGTPEMHRWVFRNALAQHYCRHVELQNWCTNGEGVAVLAWWLAERVASVFELEDQDPSHVLDQLEQGFFSRIREHWIFVRPKVIPSFLRYATLSVRSPWGVALLGQLGKLPEELFQRESATSYRPIIVRAVSGNLWHNCSFLSIENGVFALEPTRLLGTAEVLSKYDDTSEGVQILRFLLQSMKSVDTPDKLSQRLKEPDLANEVDTRMVLHNLILLSYTRNDALDLLDELLVSPMRWLESILLHGPIGALENLQDAFGELIGRTLPVRAEKPDWFYELPHALFDACISSDDEERRRLLFAMLVITSIGTDTTSALERVLKSDRRFQFNPDIENWKNRLDRIRQYGSSAIASRLRSVLVTLDQ